LGLALFVREGMAAWVHAWERVVEPDAPRRADGNRRDLSTSTAVELVHVLASMALRALN
jgi:hypothetical protein